MSSANRRPCGPHTVHSQTVSPHLVAQKCKTYLPAPALRPLDARSDRAAAITPARRRRGSPAHGPLRALQHTHDVPTHLLSLQRGGRYRWVDACSSTICRRTTTESCAPVRQAALYGQSVLYWTIHFLTYLLVLAGSFDAHISTTAAALDSPSSRTNRGRTCRSTVSRIPQVTRNGRTYWISSEAPLLGGLSARIHSQSVRLDGARM